MIKILHTADWHMDAPLREFDESQRRRLRSSMLAMPGKIADLCLREGCDLMLIAGDVFDGSYSREGYEAVYRALERVQVPVFIAPGNHDPYREGSAWDLECWPDNVHLFTRQELTSMKLEELDCRVYGAAFTGPESPGLLADFRADCAERHALLVLHADPTSVRSVYNPVTAAQLREAGLDYAALGHIHAAGRFEAGAGVCAWPGCPMGHGWDETGPKGVLIAQVDETVELRFLPLDGPGFYEYTADAGVDPFATVRNLLPPMGSADFFRVRLTGEVRSDMMEGLRDWFADFPNLTILDETVPMGDIWERAGEDSLEGLFFQILQDGCQDQDPDTVEQLELAARIARQILRGQEVQLP